MSKYGLQNGGYFVSAWMCWYTILWPQWVNKEHANTTGKQDKKYWHEDNITRSNMNEYICIYDYICHGFYVYTVIAEKPLMRLLHVEARCPYQFPISHYHS